MKSLEKKKAIQMREAGMSIKEIARILAVSKASVSVWVRSVYVSETTRQKLSKRGFTSVAIERRRKARMDNEMEKRSISVQQASKEIKTISRDGLKIIGTMLYWGEGAKTNRGIVKFANSDPLLIKIMMKFFRETCLVPESKFRGHIHTYSHLNASAAELYWSDITSIPLNQFYKTYSKPSIASKKQKDSLPFGTLDVSICDTSLFLKIMGWMKKISMLTINEAAESRKYF